MRVEQGYGSDNFNNPLSNNLNRQEQIYEDEAQRYREHKKEEAKKKQGVPAKPKKK